MVQFDKVIKYIKNYPDFTVEVTRLQSSSGVMTCWTIDDVYRFRWDMLWTRTCARKYNAVNKKNDRDLQQYLRDHINKVIAANKLTQPHQLDVFDLEAERNAGWQV